MPPPIQYEERYFFEDYKKQYGKTYLEDFPSLRRMARRRLGVIRGILEKTKPSPILPVSTSSPMDSSATPSGDGKGAPRLLDIGCAYGAFLAEAQDWGFDCQGIDPAEEAVSYVAQKLRIPVRQGLFPSADVVQDLFSQSFDVVSLWYVIEHLADLGDALRKASEILRPRGLLALATPSFSGISGRLRPTAFLRSSPPDHWTLWELGRTNKILRSYGFTLAKIVVTGHHPERFPLVGGLIKESRGPLYGFLYGLSRLFCLGDTFEVYAVKMNEVPHG
jgi:2-polyprenyl-3-methyl-5-hydroxy-6-metoxy-1,4-benzoquinol methylase